MFLIAKLVLACIYYTNACDILIHTIYFTGHSDHTSHDSPCMPLSTPCHRLNLNHQLDPCSVQLLACRRACFRARFAPLRAPVLPLVCLPLPFLAVRPRVSLHLSRMLTRTSLSSAPAPPPLLRSFARPLSTPLVRFTLMPRCHLFYVINLCTAFLVDVTTNSASPHVL